MSGRSGDGHVSAEAFKTPLKADRRKSSDVSTPSPTFAIPASPFMQKFGYGTGVSVYLMKRSPKGLSQSPWAVKKISKQCNKSNKNLYEERLNVEAKILKDLQHPNIVVHPSLLNMSMTSFPSSLWGWFTKGKSTLHYKCACYRAFTKSKDGSLCLAMEFGGDKSLHDLIESRDEEGLGPFPAAVILKVALHMARGLKYLHNEKKILHGDMKSSNVVIKGDFETIKLCDVGVSLHLDENMTVSDPKAQYIGTESWKPKETLEEGVITDKADIYAFGLTLWEMMALSIPHLILPEENDDEEDSFTEDDFDDDAYYEALGTRPALDMDKLDESYQKVIELFFVCTSENPKERPSAAQIVEALEAESVQ